MLRSFTQAATVLHVSQPARTAKIKKDAAQLGLLSGRRRMERNLLPIAERVLDPNTVQFDVQTGPLERRGLDADRRAAALLLQPATSRLPRKGRSSSIIARGRGRAETRVLGFESKCVPALLHRDDNRISFWSYHSNHPPLYVRVAGVGRPVNVRGLVVANTH
jgi:hypothetical protein